MIIFSSLISKFQMLAITCTEGGSFFDFPTWYKYACKTNLETQEGFVNAIPLIGLGILDILLRIAGLVAIGYVVFGAVKYVVSQGEPDKTSEAKGTIINALAGLIIATLAIAMVTFVGSRVSGGQ